MLLLLLIFLSPKSSLAEDTRITLEGSPNPVDEGANLTFTCSVKVTNNISCNVIPVFKFQHLDGQFNTVEKLESLGHFTIDFDNEGGKCLYQLKVEAMQKFSGWAMCGIQFLYDENFTWGNTTVTVNELNRKFPFWVIPVILVFFGGAIWALGVISVLLCYFEQRLLCNVNNAIKWSRRLLPLLQDLYPRQGHFPQQQEVEDDLPFAVEEEGDNNYKPDELVLTGSRPFGSPRCQFDTCKRRQTWGNFDALYQPAIGFESCFRVLNKDSLVFKCDSDSIARPVQSLKAEMFKEKFVAGKLSYASSKWQPLQGGDDKSSQPLETIPKQSLIETDLSVACTETDTCNFTELCNSKDVSEPGGHFEVSLKDSKTDESIEEKQGSECCADTFIYETKKNIPEDELKQCDSLEMPEDDNTKESVEENQEGYKDGITKNQGEDSHSLDHGYLDKNKFLVMALTNGYLSPNINDVLNEYCEERSENFQNKQLFDFNGNCTSAIAA